MTEGMEIGAKDLLRTVDSLCGTTDWNPGLVASLLQRRLVMSNETEDWTKFRLVGGAGIPIESGRFLWKKKRPLGSVSLTVATSLRLPLGPIREHLGGKRPPAWFGPDPRNPNSKHLYAYPAAAGEVRLIFPGFKEKYYLSEVIVSQMPMVKWADTP